MFLSIDMKLSAVTTFSTGTPIMYISIFDNIFHHKKFNQFHNKEMVWKMIGIKFMNGGLGFCGFKNISFTTIE